MRRHGAECTASSILESSVVGVPKHPPSLKRDQAVDSGASSVQNTQRILQKFKTKLRFYATFMTATGRSHVVKNRLGQQQKSGGIA